MRIAPLLAGLLVLALVATPAVGQGKDKGGRAAAGGKPGKGPKHYKVKADRAIIITREVLVKQGWAVERVDDKDGVITLWYYRGNMGQGRGRGPLQKMIIRRVQEDLVFEEAPPAIMVDIDVRLKF